MKIKDFRNSFLHQLQGVYPDEEIQQFFKMTAQQYLGYSRVDIVLNLDQEVGKDHEIIFQNVLDRLETHEPIQYILGATEFFGLSFAVTPATLIPRPETEELVAWVLKEMSSHDRILDIGTGTGCIAISIAKNQPEAFVVAYDISKEALEVAQKNAKQNQVEVTYKEVDILKTTTIPEPFDIIVSNPPYVREQEKTEMQPNVIDNEPHQALFVTDANPLKFYKKIGKLAFDNLSIGGSLYVEINQYLGEETKTLLETLGYKEVQLRQDMFGKDRMIKAVR